MRQSTIAMTPVTERPGCQRSRARRRLPTDEQLIVSFRDRLPSFNTRLIAGDCQRANAFGNEPRTILAVQLLDRKRFRPAFLLRRHGRSAVAHVTAFLPRELPDPKMTRRPSRHFGIR